jgi:hypothetical protein
VPTTTANGRGISTFQDGPSGIMSERDFACLEVPYPFKSRAPRLRGQAARLDALLAADLVDLRRVSDAIRQQPGFEQLVMRLSASLALSPDISPATVEEAAVVLGTDRLRVLVYAWSLLPQHPSSAEASAALSPLVSECRYSATEDWTPEALYLASFLWWLGLDSFDGAASRHGNRASSSGVQQEQLARLTEILLRDFMALIPFVEPALLKPRQRAALAGLGRLRKEKWA